MGRKDSNDRLLRETQVSDASKIKPMKENWTMEVHYKRGEKKKRGGQYLREHQPRRRRKALFGQKWLGSYQPRKFPRSGKIKKKKGSEL